MAATAEVGERPDAYLAEDRRRALVDGADLPEHTRGAALFLDLSGFTPLTEALVRTHGAQRGAEEVARVLDRTFAGLLTGLHDEGGAVIYFSGDAVTCWLDGDDGLRAVRAAVAMQAWLASHDVIEVGSERVRLGAKIAVAVGGARRFVVGDPRIQRLDVLAGSLMDRLAAAEQQTARGEILVDLDGAPRLAGRGPERGVGTRTYLLVTDPPDPAPATTGATTTSMGTPELPAAQSAAWVLPAVYERMRSGRGEFLTELRTATPLFLRFGGIDFDADPAAGATLDSFVCSAQRVIDGYGGALLQLTLGDKGASLYAVFGTPLAHEDDADRACAAAVELIDLQRSHPVGDLAIGLSRGRVRSGTYGHVSRRTFCCLGDPVNLAARLVAGAPAGSIHVTDELRRATGLGWEWEHVEDRRVKGREQTTAVHALTVGTRSGRRRRRHQLPPIGRETESRALEDAARLVAAGGPGRVVLVSGAAGTGKSRLVAALRPVLEELRMPAHEGEAQAFGARTGYAAWSEIWHDALGSGPTLRLDAADVTRRIAVLAPDLLSRAPLLGSLLGLAWSDNALTASLEPKLRKTSLEALSVELLARLDGPYVLVVEDAQWLDPLSVDLLAEVAAAAADLPLVLLVAARPAEAGDTDVAAVLGGAGPLTRVELADLDPDDARAMIAALVARDAGAAVASTALVELVLERSDRNPYAVEELVGAVLDAGVDPTDPVALAGLELPDQLHGLALSRLDRLGEGPRRCVKVASVVGRSFGETVLRGVYPDLGRPDQVRDDLAVVTTAGLLIGDVLPFPADGDGHRFRHVLTAEAAYASLPTEISRGLHTQAAYWLTAHDRTAAGPELDLLAFHAGRGSDADLQRRVLPRAGRQARQAYANATAVDHFTRALPVLEGADRRAVLLELGAVQELVGDWPAASATLASALAESEAADDRPRAAATLTALAELDRKQGSYAQAEALLGRAREAYAALADQAGLGEVLHVSGTLAAQQGDFDRARERYGESLEIRQRLGDRAKTAALHSNLAVVAEYEGDLDRAADLNQRALDLRREVGDRWAIGVSENNLGMIALLRKDPEQALQRFSEALRLNEEVGDRWMVAIAHNNLGNALRDLDRPAEAVGHLLQAMVRYRRQHDRWALAIVYEDLATLALARDRGDVALALIGAADAVREELGSPRAPAQQQAMDEALAPLRSATSDAEEQLAAGRELSGTDLDQLVRALRQD